MALITDIVAELQTLTEVSTTVGARIYPLVDSDQILPSIVYNSRGLVGESFTKDSVTLRETFLQMDVYSASYTELDSIRSAILDHFNGFTGQFNSNTTVSSCRIVTTREGLDNTNRMVYRATIEFNILST